MMMTDGDEFSLCEEVDFHVSYQSLKMSMEEEQKDAEFPVSFEDFKQVIISSPELKAQRSFLIKICLLSVALSSLFFP